MPHDPLAGFLMVVFGLILIIARPALRGDKLKRGPESKRRSYYEETPDVALPDGDGGLEREPDR